MRPKELWKICMMQLHSLDGATSTGQHQRYLLEIIKYATMYWLRWQCDVKNIARSRTVGKISRSKFTSDSDWPKFCPPYQGTKVLIRPCLKLRYSWGSEPLSSTMCHWLRATLPCTKQQADQSSHLTNQPITSLMCPAVSPPSICVTNQWQPHRVWHYLWSSTETVMFTSRADTLEMCKQLKLFKHGNHSTDNVKFPDNSLSVCGTPPLHRAGKRK